MYDTWYIHHETYTYEYKYVCVYIYIYIYIDINQAAGLGGRDSIIIYYIFI